MLIQTQSGRIFPLMNPAPGDVDWRDMAVSLGRLCRFNGHVSRFYSVAQHSVLAARVMRQAVSSERERQTLLAAADAQARDGLLALFRRAETDDGTANNLILAALLHDGHEAYLGDITTPVAQALARCAGQDHIQGLKARIDAAIFAAAGLPWPLPAAQAQAVKAVDRIMLETEHRDLLLERPDHWPVRADLTASFVVTPEPEHRAGDTFLSALCNLLGWR